MNISPFTIAIDTREQLPYSFQDLRIDRRKAFILTATRTLSTGDYSILGSENKICVERKSLADLYGTLITGRDRFIRELERMQIFERSLVVIEATWRQIIDPESFDPSWHSKIHPNSIIGSIVAFAGEFRNTRWKAAGNRRGGEKATFKFLLNWFNGLENEEEFNEIGGQNNGIESRDIVAAGHRCGIS